MVPGPNGKPTVDPAIIHTGFPTIRPNWDHNTTEGKERLKVYHHTLLEDLNMAATWPANMSKIYNVRQGTEESPPAFLDAYRRPLRCYIPYDPDLPL